MHIYMYAHIVCLCFGSCDQCSCHQCRITFDIHTKLFFLAASTSAFWLSPAWWAAFFAINALLGHETASPFGPIAKSSALREFVWLARLRYLIALEGVDGSGLVIFDILSMSSRVEIFSASEICFMSRFLHWLFVSTSRMPCVTRGRSMLGCQAYITGV